MKYNPRKHRLPIFETSGLLLVDKPVGWTSFDVVNMLRNRFNIPKVGHCGTLDPAATGLLVLVLGKFTKLSQKLSGEVKLYEATMLLGVETDSQDMDGNIVAENDCSTITEESLHNVISQFVGPQKQTPPMVSAVKKDGKRLYELARQGIVVERDPKDIIIDYIKIGPFVSPYCDLTVKCSKGTYVRTLCYDIGRKLGCGATLYQLRRLASGQFNLQDAVSIDTVKTWDQSELDDYLRKFLVDKISKEF